MATTIINPAPTNNDTSGGNGVGFLIGIITLVIIGALFFMYGLPFIRGMIGNGGISVNVPKDINVNVQQSK